MDNQMTKDKIRKITQGPDLYVNTMDLGRLFREKAKVRLEQARLLADSDNEGVRLSASEAIGEANSFLEANQITHDMQKEVLDRFVSARWWQFWKYL